MVTAEDGCSPGEGGGGGTVVVVGVKLDEQSRELLTWALVKVVQPGDRVIALHVLTPRAAAAAGKSALLSLVKSFDSVLAAYEGFCNLKQVDLSLKVCRGSSVPNILVQEAKSYPAAKVVVGTSRTHHRIRSMTSVAKYCAKKLPKDFWVLAVGNGKVAFEKEAHHPMEKLKDDGKHRNLVRLIHQSLSKNWKSQHQEHCGIEQKWGSDHSWKTSVRNRNSSLVLEDSPESEDVDNSLSMVPIETPEATLGSISTTCQDRHCRLNIHWLHFHHIFSYRRKSYKIEKKRAMSLPNGQCAAVYPDKKKNICEHVDLNRDVVNGAIVLVGPDAELPPSSPVYNSKRLPEELEGLLEKHSSTCRLFSYKELCSLTSNFMPEKMVGKGGNSRVYRGCLPDGRDLAVKVLEPTANLLKEFVLEIDIITSLHHKNIISLFGFCFEDNNLILVYDYLSRGSLEENLHVCRHNDGLSFGWGERYKVALGVAEALDYLHNITAQPVIHGDVKSSNILLLDDFEPQLCDFGLATLAPTSLSHVTCTDVAGTFGYLAPEYFIYGKVDNKVDVYAYGVVLLELLSGRKPINGQENLVTWAKPVLKGGKFSQLLDPSVGGDYDQDLVERLVLAATLCIGHSPRCRPSISQVLKLLQGDTELRDWARKEVVALGELNNTKHGGVFPGDMQSYLDLALRDLDGDSDSSCSTDQSVSVEDYLHGRWNRAASF